MSRHLDNQRLLWAEATVVTSGAMMALAGFALAIQAALDGDRATGTFFALRATIPAGIVTAGLLVCRFHSGEPLARPMFYTGLAWLLVGLWLRWV